MRGAGAAGAEEGIGDLSSDDPAADPAGDDQNWVGGDWIGGD